MILRFRDPFGDTHVRADDVVAIESPPPRLAEQEPPVRCVISLRGDGAEMWCYDPIDEVVARWREALSYGRAVTLESPGHVEAGIRDVVVGPATIGEGEGSVFEPRVEVTVRDRKGMPVDEFIETGEDVVVTQGTRELIEEAVAKCHMLEGDVLLLIHRGYMV
jgi:hypothetical protein